MTIAFASAGLSDLELLQNALDGTASLRTRIVWLVGRPGTGKTKLLHGLAQSRSDWEYINVNRELAKALQHLPSASRPFVAAGCLSAILPARTSGAWLADNTELALSRNLQLAVVERFKAIGQQVSLVVAWCGEYLDNKLIYGTPEHADYRVFPLEHAVVIDLNNSNNQRH